MYLEGKLMKVIKILGLLLIVVALSSFAFAAEEYTFNTQTAYGWLLAQKQEDNSYGSFADTAWAVLALTEGGMYSAAEESSTYFDDNFGAGCFPEQSCKVKDTSLGVLALEELASTENFTDIEAWYNDVLQAYSGSGRYLLELSPAPTGTCTLTFEASGVEQSIDVEVNEGKFPGCGNSYFLDIDSCVKPNLLKTNPGVNIQVDCSSLDAAPIVTALYKSSNTFYIIDTQEGAVVDLSFSNGCFGRGPGDSCNKDATLYASWALGRLASEIEVSFYLKDSYDRNDAENNAILYMSSPSSLYLSELKRLQSTDGSWNKDVVTTALAVLALDMDPATYSEEISDAKNWLAKTQRGDGSMNGKVADTAITLYAAFAADAEGPVEPYEFECDYDGICDDEEDSACEDCMEEAECGDGWCDTYAGEDEFSCPEDCETEAECGDGICDEDYEDIDTCVDDCYCGDGVCDYVERSALEDDYAYCDDDCTYGEACDYDGECDEGEGDDCDDCAQLTTEPKPEKDEKKSGIGKYLLILAILVILGAAGFYAYKKGLFGGKGKQEKPRSPFGGKPYSPFSSKLQQKKTGPGPLVSRPAKTRPVVGPGAKPAGKGFESALDKSLDEAKKLLKKK